MTWDEVEAHWKQLKGQVKTQWAKLTHDDFAAIEGHRDRLIGALQERYHESKERAEQEVEDWLRRLHGERPRTA